VNVNLVKINDLESDFHFILRKVLAYCLRYPYLCTLLRWD